MSGSIDTVLAVLEIARRHLNESDAANAGSYPSNQHLSVNSMQVEGTLDLATPLHAYMAVRDGIYTSNTINARTLKQTRDSVRNEMNLLRLHKTPNRTISQLAREAIDPEYILSEFIRGCDEWLVVRQLPSCQCVQSEHNSHERIHPLQEEHVTAADGDVLNTFVTQYLGQRTAPCSACRATASTWSPHYEPRQEKAWIEGGATSAPAFLAVAVRFAATTFQANMFLCITAGTIPLSNNVCVKYRPQSVIYQSDNHCIADLRISDRRMQYNNKTHNGVVQFGKFVDRTSQLAYPFAVRNTTEPFNGPGLFKPTVVIFERHN